MAGRVCAEGGEDAAGVGGLGEREFAVGPEGVEAGGVEGGAGGFVQMPEPGLGVSALGEGVPGAEAGGEVREDGVVVAGLGVGGSGGVHGDHDGVGGGGADVLAFQRRGAREDDVGVARGGGPGAFMHDDGVGAGEGAAEAGEVLVVVEGVAAGPVDQADVGVGEVLAVELEGLAGVQQHVGDAGAGDERLDGVAALRKRGDGRGDVAAAVMGEGAEGVAEASAGAADLAEGGGERQPGPDGLLAVFGALQAVGNGDEGGAAGDAAGEGDDGRFGDAGEGGRPGGGLGLVVGVAEQIGGEAVPALAVGGEEPARRAGSRSAGCAAGRG